MISDLFFYIICVLPRYLTFSLTMFCVRPYVIYMLRDMDIMEDLYDIRRVSKWLCNCVQCYATYTHRAKLYKKWRERVRSCSAVYT